MDVRREGFEYTIDGSLRILVAGEQGDRLAVHVEPTFQEVGEDATFALSGHETDNDVADKKGAVWERRFDRGQDYGRRD